MSEEPKISVVLPVKNGERYLEAAISSILGQTFRHIELLVVDDHSDDRTHEIAERFRSADGRIIFLKNPGNGLVDGLNFGVASAKAGLIARMDADDIALPDRLQRQYDFLLAHPEYDVVGSQVREIDEEGVFTGKTTTLPEHPSDVSEKLLEFCTLRHPTVLMRRAAFEAAGGYRPQCVAAEDLDLWLRMAERGRLINLHEPLLHYRVHPGQVSQEKIWTQRLSRNLAIISAQERRAGRGDPLEGYHCFSRNASHHECQGRGCGSMICESIKVFALAQRLLTDSSAHLERTEARLLLRYISRHSIGDGRTNRLRLAMIIFRKAVEWRAAFLLTEALMISFRLHPGRTFSSLLKAK